MTTDMKPNGDLSSPITELRGLYREAEAKATRFRLLVETRSALDAQPLENALGRALALIHDFTNAAVTLEVAGINLANDPRTGSHTDAPFDVEFQFFLGQGVPPGKLILSGLPRQGLPGGEDRQTLQLVADQIGAAIRENTRARESQRLLGDLAAREHDLALLVAEMIGAQERERSRVAYDLHDGVAQTMVSLLHHLQAAEAKPGLPAAALTDFKHCIDIARHCVVDIRRAIADLRPAELDDLGLVAALHGKLDSARLPKVLFRPALRTSRLPGASEIVLFRVAQEAIANVEKHAQAATLSVDLTEQQDGTVTLIVADDGCGIANGTEEHGRGHGFGLTTMRERLALIGGTLSITSTAGAGTILTAVVPQQPFSEIQP